MSIDLNKSPDYERLIETLLKKTAAGKLSWHETANEDTFVASVKGQRSFKVSRPSQIPNNFNKSAFDIIVTVVDAEGKNLFEIRSGTVLAKNLYSLARRLAMKIDENIESTVELLQNL